MHKKLLEIDITQPQGEARLAASRAPPTVVHMSRCRRDSFYLAPGLLRYFKDHTLATWDPETGKLVRFFHRGDIAAFERRFPAWDGVCLLAERGGLGSLQKMLREKPSNVELWRLDSRLVEGRRPADACTYAMHRWAVEGSIPGGARSLIPLLFPSAEPLHKGLHTAALHALTANAQLAVHIVSAAWQAGLFTSPAQAASILRDLTPRSQGVLVEPDPRLVSMLSTSLDPGRLDIKSLLTELANPLSHINPAAVSIALDLPAPLRVLKQLEMSADEDMLGRIWKHRNYPREEYLASVRRAATSKSDDIRYLAANQRDLPDELLFEFAVSKDPILAKGALYTIQNALLGTHMPGAIQDRWTAESPQAQAERTTRLVDVAIRAWKSGNADIKLSVFGLAEVLDKELLTSLTDELLRSPFPLNMSADAVNLYAHVALSRSQDGAPVTGESWEYIRKLVVAASDSATPGGWSSPDIEDALRFGIRDNVRYSYTNIHTLLYEGLDPADLSVPQHVVDAIISSKKQGLLKALAANPFLTHETIRRLLSIDADGSLASQIAMYTADHEILRELFVKDVKLAKLVASNPFAPRDLLLAVAADKATYDAAPHGQGDRDAFGLHAPSTYEEVMRNRGLHEMTLEELEGFLAAQRGDGSPHARDYTKTLRSLVCKTQDPRIMRLALEAQPELWLDVLDRPNLPPDLRRVFIAAAVAGDGGLLGLESDRFGSILQNWLAHTNTVSSDELWTLAGSPNMWTRVHVAEYKDTPPDLLEYLSQDKDSKVLAAVLVHRNTPPAAIDRYVANPPSHHLGAPRDGLIKASYREDLSQESAWTLAGNKDDYIRCGVAYKTTDVELIQLLAADPTPRVRESLAANTTTPLDILLQLVKDESPWVRSLAATNLSLPQDVLLGMLNDGDAHVVKYALAACYARGIPVSTDTLSALFEHPDILEKYVRRGRERSWWWNQNIAREMQNETGSRIQVKEDTSPLAFVGRMLNYEDPKTHTLLAKLLDSGSFNADPDMRECAERLLNRPLPLRLRSLEEQRQFNTPAPGPVDGLDALGIATIPYPMEGFRAELTERLTTAPVLDVPGYGRLVPRVIQSPAAQRRNGNYMGNCTFSYHGDGTKAGYKIVVGLYGEGSNDPVLNALVVRASTGWEIEEVNSRFNKNVSRAAAEVVSAALSLPLDTRHNYLD